MKLSQKAVERRPPAVNLAEVIEVEVVDEM